MCGFKQDIKHEIFLRHPTNIMEAMKNAHHIQDKNKVIHKSTIGAYTTTRDRFGGHNTSVPQTKRLTSQQMDERREKRTMFQL
jgi:hypothetical protein